MQRLRVKSQQLVKNKEQNHKVKKNEGKTTIALQNRGKNTKKTLKSYENI